MTSSPLPFPAWKVGDRVRATRFGESKNGTVVATAYHGEVVMVQRDGEPVERHYLASSLKPVQLRTRHVAIIPEEARPR